MGAETSSFGIRTSAAPQPHSPSTFKSLTASPLFRVLQLLILFPLLFGTLFQTAQASAIPQPEPYAQDLTAAGGRRPPLPPRMSLPTIVLVPGAWHSPVHYAPLIALLKLAKYDVVSQRLPSVGSSTPKQQSVAGDTTFIQNNVLKPLLDDGKDVVMLLHSYGGCPGAAAAKGQSKAERTAAGKQGGIIGLVFMCAFVAREGDSLKSNLPGQVYDPWVLENTETGQLTVQNPKDVFYNDVPTVAANLAIAALQPQAEKALSSPSGPPAWPDAVFDGRRAYIQTEQDHTIPFVAQDAMVTYSGVTWDVLKLNASHSPFLSETKKVADFVIAKAQAWD